MNFFPSIQALSHSFFLIVILDTQFLLFPGLQCQLLPWNCHFRSIFTCFQCLKMSHFRHFNGCAMVFHCGIFISLMTDHVEYLCMCSFSNKGLSNQGYGFSSNHVWMTLLAKCWLNQSDIFFLVCFYWFSYYFMLSDWYIY